MVKENNRQLFEFLRQKLTPSKANTALLEEWPATAAEAVTHAIEATLVEEDEDE